MSWINVQRRVISTVAATAVLATTAMMTTSVPAGAQSSLCQKVSLAEVSSTLGVKATRVTPTINGNVTVCWYKVGSNANAVFVRLQTHDNSAGFSADKKLAAQEDEKPVADKHFGPWNAFSTSIGSPSYGYTYSVTILKSSTELAVGAAHSRLASVEALARKVLPLA